MSGSVEIRLRTTRKLERRDITKEVAKAATELGVLSGALFVSLPHTTAAVVVGEAWDPEVTSDIERALAAWVPGVRFDHAEGNSPAHFLSEAIGVSCFIPLEKGKLVLGRWQGVFLIELDGPRERNIQVRALASG